MAKRKTKDALEILYRMIGDDDVLRRLVDEETVNSRVASLIYEARKRAGLTQKQLAGIIGSTQSVIARLESSDYKGHSLSILVRIAGALGKRVVIGMVPRKGSRRTA